MRKLFLLLFTFLIIFQNTNFTVRAEEQLNELTLKIELDNSNSKLLEIAGENVYSVKNSIFTVFNSKNEDVGKFFIDENGIGHVNDINGNTIMFLDDDTYVIKQTTGFKGYKNIEDKKLTLSKAPIPPNNVSINNVTYLYGYDGSGEVFDRNELMMWKTDFGTGAILCGDSGYAAPKEIEVPSRGGYWGERLVSTKDWSLLPRNSDINELVYKIMYYGYNGPKMWSGFSNYRSPASSRDGSTYFNTNESGSKLLAYYITHEAISKAFNRPGVMSDRQKVQGFNAFWSFVNSAPEAPKNFYVYRWNNDSDNYSYGKPVQAVYSSAIGSSEKDVKNIEVKTYPLFSSLETLLTKFNTRNEYLSDVEFTITYFADELTNPPITKWILKTDENGQLKIKDEYLVSGDSLFKDCEGRYVLLIGNYLIEETKVPDGYIKSNKMIIEVKDDGDPILWNGDKTQQLTYETEKGYELLEYKKAYFQIHKTTDDPELENDNSIIGSKYGLYIDKECKNLAKDIEDNECIITIKENKYSDVLVMKPGTYYLKELETSFMWSVDEIIHEIELVESFNVDIRTVKEHTNKAQEFSLKTNASYSEIDNGHQGSINATFRLIDVVEYENLKPGHEYSIKTTLIDKNTKKEICDLNNQTITLETKFTPEKSNGQIEIEFEEDAKVVLNKTIVIFEELFHDNKSLYQHFDLEDTKQTLIFPELKCAVAVTKVDFEDETKTLENCEFTIFNLDGSIARDIYGDLAIKKTKEDGTTSFELNYPDTGYYLMETKAPEGYEVSTKKFEINVSENIEEAKINPVQIKVADEKFQPVKTGDSANLFIWFGSFLISLLSTVFVIRRLII